MNTSELLVLEQKITAPEFIKELQSAVEGNFNLNMAVQCSFAMEAIKTNQALQSCSEESIMKSIRDVTLLGGLSLNPKLCQVVLIPRKKQCILDIQYQGMITLLKEYKVAKEVFANVIYQGDEFEYDFAINKVVKYVPYHYRKDTEGNKLAVERGEALGVYACAYRFDDYYQYIYMPIERVYEIRDETESYKAAMAKKAKGEWYSTIWEGANEGEMIKKTAIRYLWKMMAKSEDFTKLADAMGFHDEANAMTDKTHVSPDNKVKLKGNNDNLTNHTAGKNKEVQMKENISDAIIIPDAISSDAVEVIVAAFNEGYTLDKNKTKRALNEVKEMEAIIKEKGFSDELMKEAFGGGNDTVKSVRDLLYKGNVATIERLLKKAYEIYETKVAAHDEQQGQEQEQQQ